MMFQLANKIRLVFLAMTVLIVSCQTVKASDSGMASFMFARAMFLAKRVCLNSARFVNLI
jgi:hypothetical protein